MSDKNALHPTSKKEKFLDAAERFFTVSEISEDTGIARSSHYDWLRDDPAYAAEFTKRHEKAKRKHCDEIIKEIVRRGQKGVNQPVYQGGQLVGRIRKYSDTLLIFHAKAVLPKMYNPQSITPEQLADALIAFSDTVLECVPPEKQQETREKLTKLAVAVANGKNLEEEFTRITDTGAKNDE